MPIDPDICKINRGISRTPMNNGAITPAVNHAIDNPFRKSDKYFR